MYAPLDQDDLLQGLHDPAERHAAGRMIGLLWIIGGVTGAAWYLVPGADVSHWQLGLVTASLSALTGVACSIAPWRRMSPAWIYVAAGLSLLVIPVVMAINGGAESPTVLYLFMASVLFGYYLPTGAAVAFLSIGMLVPATPLLYDSAALEPDFIGRLVLTAPIYAAVGLAVVLAKRQLVGWRNQALQQALRDPLTGLPNRRALTNALRREMANSHPQTPVALLMIDLDDFKAVNTAHGHVGGDQVLRGVADVLRRSTRADDLVARLGGDEFAILVAHASEPELARLSQRIVEAIRWAEIAVEPGGCKVTASVGVAMPNRRDGDVDELLGYADREMRQAKRAGKDRWDAGALKPVATA